MTRYYARQLGLSCAIKTTLTRVLLAGALMAAMVVGQHSGPNNGVVFIFPTGGQVYNKMDTVNVTYTSSFPTPNLYLWCDPGNLRKILVQAAPGYNATVPVTLNFKSDTRCWFNLRPGTAAGFGANSPGFNLIDEERKSGRMVFGPESSTDPKPTRTTTSADAGVTHPAASSAPPNSTAGEGGLGVEAAVGIGAGVAVGVVVICGVFAWIRRRRRRNMEGCDQEGGSQEGDSQEGADQEQYQASHSSNEELLEKQEPGVLARPVDFRRNGHRYGAKPKFIAELSSAHHTPPEIGSSQILDPRHPLAAPGRGPFM